MCAACTPPAHIVLTRIVPPDAAQEPIDVVAVAPVDARRPGSRADGGVFDHFPLPLATHGNVNTVPYPIDAVDRLQRDVLEGLGANEHSAEGYTLRLTVREHVGRREASSAWMVSKVTAGVSGTIGGLIVPGWITVDAVVDAELVGADGAVIASRRLATHQEHQRALTKQSPLWSLWTRRPARKMMTAAFADGHQALADQLAAFLIDTANGVTGEVVVPYAWDPPSLFAPPAADPRFGSERAHPLGGPLDRGQVLGRIGLPTLRAGYDGGLTDAWTAIFDVSAVAAVVPGSSTAELPAPLRTPVGIATRDVVSVDNSLGGGLRWMSRHDDAAWGLELVADAVLTWTSVDAPATSWTVRPGVLVTAGGPRSGIVTKMDMVMSPTQTEIGLAPGAEFSLTRALSLGVALRLAQPILPEWSPLSGAPQQVLGLR